MWEAYLEEYPDAEKKGWILRGIENGVNIGLVGTATHPRCVKNLAMSAKDKLSVGEWVEKQSDAGHMLGPFLTEDVPYDKWSRSPMGAVPKPNGTIRPITHLSKASLTSPSVNEQLYEPWRHCTLPTFLEVVEMFWVLLPGAWLWLIDLESAYRQVRIQAAQAQHLGVQIFGFWFFDVTLPFGLATAPFLFLLYAEALRWIMKHWAAPLFQVMTSYLDDFFGGQATRARAQAAIDRFTAIAELLGWSIQKKKVMLGQRLKILGIIYDTRSRTCSLPEGKRQALSGRISRLLAKGKGSRKEYEQLTGDLGYASNVDLSLRTRLPMLYRAVYSDVPERVPVAQVPAMRRDLEWLKTRIDEKRSRHWFDVLQRLSEHQTFTSSDASGKIGGGGYSEWGYWKLPWPRWMVERPNVPGLELYCVALTLRTFHEHLRGRQVIHRCDCQPAVFAWRKRYSSRRWLAAVLRVLLEIVEEYAIDLRMVHIPREENRASDALSNLDHSKFLEVVEAEGCPWQDEEWEAGGADHASLRGHLRDLSQGF